MMKPAPLMMACLGSMLLALAGSSCTTKPAPKTINNQVYTDVIPWKRSQIVGLEITLEDKEAVEYMLFHKDGDISITLGTKGGAICAPLYRWKLASGCLIITNYHYKPYDEFSLVSLSRDTLLVRRKYGQLSKFKVHPH